MIYLLCRVGLSSAWWHRMWRTRPPKAWAATDWRKYENRSAHGGSLRCGRPDPRAAHTRRRCSCRKKANISTQVFIPQHYIVVAVVVTELSLVASYYCWWNVQLLARIRDTRRSHYRWVPLGGLGGVYATACSPLLNGPSPGTLRTSQCNLFEKRI